MHCAGRGERSVHLISGKYTSVLISANNLFSTNLLSLTILLFLNTIM